jgi:hypothetical protein
MSSTNQRYYEDARSSYYERLIYPAGFQNFIEISRNNYESVFNSVIPLAFKTLLFGDSEKTVVKKLGKPRYISKDNGFSPLVLYYKENLMNHNLLIQVHFFNGEFVLATQSIIDTDLKWREIVKITIIEKYAGNDKSSALEKSGVTSVVFTDEFENRIFLLESINLNILYLSGDPKHYQFIEDFTRLKIKKINDQVENLKSLLKDSF